MTGEEQMQQQQAAETHDLVSELLGEQAGGAKADRQPRGEVDGEREREPARREDAKEEGRERPDDEPDGETDDPPEGEGGDAEGEEDAEGVADDDGEGDTKDDEGHAGNDSIEGLTAPQLRQRVQALLKAGNLKAALKLATGQDPAAFAINEAKYTAFRQHEARERQKTRQAALKVETDRRNLQAEVQRTVAQLQPFAKLQQAAQAYQQSGDTRHVRAIVEGLMGRPYNEAQKALLADEKRSPSEQAMASRLEQIQRELAELKQGGQKQQQTQTAEQIYARDIEWLGGQVRQLGDSELAAIPKVSERIHRVLMASRDPVGGRVTLTVEEAAERVKAGERRRVEKSPFFRRVVKQAPAPKPAASPAPLRRDSRQTAARVGDPTEEEIIQELISQTQRRRPA